MPLAINYQLAKHDRHKPVCQAMKFAVPALLLQHLVLQASSPALLPAYHQEIMSCTWSCNIMWLQQQDSFSDRAVSLLLERIVTEHVQPAEDNTLPTQHRDLTSHAILSCFNLCNSCSRVAQSSAAIHVNTCTTLQNLIDYLSKQHDDSTVKVLNISAA